MDEWNSVPNEIFARIFNHLILPDVINCETVSRRWYVAVRNHFESIRHLGLQSILYGEEDGLNFHRYHKTLDQVLSRCPNLSSLKLCSPRKHRNVLNFTAKHELTITALGIIAKRCSCLDSLDISYHIFSNEVVLEFLVANLPPSLKTLKMDYCRLDVLNEQWTIQDEEFYRMDQLLTLLFRRLIYLKCLTLRGTCSGFFQLTSYPLSSLSDTINHLDLSGNFSAKLADLEFVKRLPNLHTLLLERCHIEQSDLELLVSSVPTLKTLGLSFCHKIKDFGLISKLHDLETLVLDGNRENVTDEVLQPILGNCLKLRTLSLENCRLLTDLSLCHLNKLKGLKFLSLSSIPKLSGQTLTTICMNCVKLEELHLKFCKKLSPESLSSLTNLKQLRKLYINGVDGFSQTVLRILISETPLEHCEALGCSGISMNSGLQKCSITLSA